MQRRIDSPPSLVTDRFGTPASDDDLRLAAAAHLTDGADGIRRDADAKILQTVRALREAARTVTKRNLAGTDGDHL